MNSSGHHNNDTNVLWRVIYPSIRSALYPMSERPRENGQERQRARARTSSNEQNKKSLPERAEWSSKEPMGA
jgi:hypothetical protein